MRTTIEQHQEERGSGPHTGERCECRHNGTRWTAQCDAAKAYSDALHALWATDHQKSRPGWCAAAESYRGSLAEEVAQRKAAMALPQPPTPNNEDLI